VRALLESLCDSRTVARTAALIRRRLGRPLEPFDLWYPGFEPAARRDALAQRLWPDAAAYRADRPRLLTALGFPADQATGLWSDCSGHPAPGPAPGRLEGSEAFRALRADGDWIAQRLALRGAASPLLAGVPNRACAAALARSYRGLLLTRLDPAGAGPRALAALWNGYRDAGQALVELAAWRWLYEHPEADAGQLRQALPALAGEVWNRHFAALLGQKDCPLLAADPRLSSADLTLADAPLGRMMAAQLQARIGQSGDPAGELARMAALGRLTPDLWMRRAAGTPLGPEALLEAADKAIEQTAADA
jgi:hypothetical protein